MKNNPLHFGLSPQDAEHVQIQHKFKGGTHQYHLNVSDQARLTQPLLLQGTASESVKIELTIQVGQNASADFIEQWEGVKVPTIDFKLNLKAEAHSQLRYIALQSQEEIEHWQEERHTQAQERARIELFIFHFGAHSILSQVEQNAEGRQAHLETWITCRRQDKQSMKLNYQHGFHKPNGSGRAHLQGVALDESQLEMNGNIVIGPHGSGTDTHLEVKALNLSPKAQVNALPGLEVDTNDVKAGHSAAVHNLNPEQLIYTQSRGLSEKEAKRLMIEGFLKKGLKGLKDLPSVYEKVQQLI